MSGHAHTTRAPRADVQGLPGRSSAPVRSSRPCRSSSTPGRAGKIIGRETSFTIILAVAVVKAVAGRHVLHAPEVDWGKLGFLIVPASSSRYMMMFVLMPDIVLAWRRPVGRWLTEAPPPPCDSLVGLLAACSCLAPPGPPPDDFGPVGRTSP